MSEKIVVPEGMLEAAQNFYNDPTRPWDACTVEAILEEALRWLSENPIVPEDLVYDELRDEAETFHMPDRKMKVWKRMCAEWQRRMFLAPEPEAPTTFDTPFGRFEIDARVPPGEIRLHDWSGPTIIRNVGTEPQVPEEIASLQKIDLASVQTQDELDRLVTQLNLEAYRRGQKAARVQAMREEA